jgi:hypothetical protein
MMFALRLDYHRAWKQFEVARQRVLARPFQFDLQIELQRAGSELREAGERAYHGMTLEDALAMGEDLAQRPFKLWLTVARS